MSQWLVQCLAPVPDSKSLLMPPWQVPTVVAQVVGFLAPMGEPRVEFPIPGFGTGSTLAVV